MLSRCYKEIAAICASIMLFVIGIGKYICTSIANAIEEIARHQEAFKKIKTVLGNGALYALTPFLLIFILAVTLLSKMLRYVYRWLATGITALRAILAVIEESRGVGNDQLDETIESSGFTYDSQQDIFYSIMNGWQRDFGYCRMYDEAAAPLGMIVDSEPIYFEYEGKKWLIEFWKGQYDLTTGCEIGVYTTEGPALDIPHVFNGTFYNSGSNSERLEMSFSLKKRGKTLFVREDKHWWLTGFKLGEFSKPLELIMKINITLKDETMCNAFVKGLYNAGYSDAEIEKYGDTVSFKFGKPYTPQAYTRTRLTDWMIQRKNKYLCDKFQDLTGAYNNAPDKLKVIQKKAPKLYKKIIKIGKTKKLFKKGKIINNYFN